LWESSRCLRIRKHEELNELKGLHKDYIVGIPLQRDSV
jgi:hypothetical protein